MSDEVTATAEPESFRAAEAFKMHYDHLLCSFAKGEVIPEHVAKYAIETGAPVEPVFPEVPEVDAELEALKARIAELEDEIELERMAWAEEKQKAADAAANTKRQPKAAPKE